MVRICTMYIFGPIIWSECAYTVFLLVQLRDWTSRLSILISTTICAINRLNSIKWRIHIYLTLDSNNRLWDIPEINIKNKHRLSIDTRKRNYYRQTNRQNEYRVDAHRVRGTFTKNVRVLSWKGVEKITYPPKRFIRTDAHFELQRSFVTINLLHELHS